VPAGEESELQNENALNWLNTIGIAFGLAMDAFAVAIVVGLAVEKLTRGRVFRLSFHFGLFQFMMPIFGWLAGRTVAQYIGGYDHWLAFGLLTVIGGKMLWDARSESGAEYGSDPTRAWTLIVLSIATSIDALAVGLSMALIGVSIWLPSIVIGVVAAAMTVVGMCFGSRLRRRGGQWAQVAGGLVLIGIGVRIVISHLAA